MVTKQSSQDKTNGPDQNSQYINNCVFIKNNNYSICGACLQVINWAENRDARMQVQPHHIQAEERDQSLGDKPTQCGRDIPFKYSQGMRKGININITAAELLLYN